MNRTLSISQIETFLEVVDKTFPIPLSQKQNLTDYAKKLFEKATLCASVDGDEIVSMVAGYTDNLPEDIAYIAIVATLPTARGKGYAKQLINDFIKICRTKKIPAVHLFAAPDNVVAMNMYRNLGFRDYVVADETRKEDAHLIYYLEEI